MASFNRVVLVGNLTRDIELKYLQSGTAVTEIGLAVNDRRKNQQTGEWIEEPVFVDVTLWGRTAEIASEYLNKGSNVLIEGRLKYDQWEKDGQKRSKLRVIGETMQMLGSRTGGGNSGGGSSGGGSSGGSSRSGASSENTAGTRSGQSLTSHFDESEFHNGSHSSGHTSDSDMASAIPAAGSTAPATKPADTIPF